MMRAIGLMSGTSLDGIDVALIETDGEGLRVTRGHNGRIEPLGPTLCRDYAEEDRALLRRALDDAVAITRRTERPGCLRAAEDLVTRRHAEAVEAFLAENRLSPGEIDLVGFHGQTVIHRPAEGLTVQIGDGAALSRRLGIPVVSDLRQADVAAGGQGAPLVPVFHRALARASGFTGDLAVLNIGGVANVTLIAGSDDLVAFDTGPGNALVDDWVKERTGQGFDAGGRLAAAGRPDEALLAWLLVHPFFTRRPPKSLDRNAFSHRVVGQLPTEDGAATLTAFTVRAIARALDFADALPPRWIVAGGGAKNDEMLRLLRHHLRTEVMRADEVGWSSAFLEAQAFAYLAVRSLKGLPLTVPSTTGVREPVTGGVLARP
ncbi:anhydro-N-acetylmuramic acid kinase [Methylobacterium sp. ID0610]|uniref:anhydro-N-acetylmuramic acid kinase n=1 Tax=Methylobacterium carpenticola TaxID=3344827 RepID=UPI0036C94CE2